MITSLSVSIYSVSHENLISSSILCTREAVFLWWRHTLFVCIRFIFFCVWLVLLPHTGRVVRSALCVVSLVPNWFNVQCNHTNEIWGTPPLSLSRLPPPFLFYQHTHTHIEATSLSWERFSVLFFFHFLFFVDFTEQGKKKLFNNVDHVKSASDRCFLGRRWRKS